MVVFGNLFGFGSDWAVSHGVVGAFANRPPEFAQVVAVGKKYELERLELVDTPAGSGRARKFKACVALR